MFNNNRLVTKDLEPESETGTKTPKDHRPDPGMARTKGQNRSWAEPDMAGYMGRTGHGQNRTWAYLRGRLGTPAGTEAVISALAPTAPPNDLFNKM